MKIIPERTIALQGLRILFITDIVFGHSSHGFLGGGGAECSFFFVVSGFLYVNKPNTYHDYLWKKIKHIFPPYWICLVILLCGFALKGHLVEHGFGWDIIPHIFLVQSWIPVTDSWYFKYLGTSWFISSLLFCYIIAPPIYHLVNSFKKWMLLQILLTSIIICFILEDVSPYALWLTYASPVIRVFEFLLGMQVKMWLNDIPYKESRLAYLTPVILFLYIVILRYTNWGLHYSFFHAFVIGYLWLFRSHITNVVCGNKVILRLADASIFIYLIQMPILRALGQTVHSAIITIVIGYLFYEVYNYIERRLCVV